jgi:hypothetical protein
LSSRRLSPHAPREGDDVFVFRFADDVFLIQMPASPDQVFGAIVVDELAGIFVGFFPVESADDGIFPCLGIKGVIEFFFGMGTADLLFRMLRVAS